MRALTEVENFVMENKHLGYKTKEEFIKEAIRFKLNALRGRYEYIEKPKKMRKAAKIIGQLKAYPLDKTNRSK